MSRGRAAATPPISLPGSGPAPAAPYASRAGGSISGPPTPRGSGPATWQARCAKATASPLRCSTAGEGKGRAWLDRDRGEQRGAVTGRASHGERAAERFDAVTQPGQPGPQSGVSSPDPVVTDSQPHDRARRGQV